ncbi:uncharacterized protein FOMMEDRAFT_159595 [Fomitiporia mediterranea MF3/22]|uniref:uncharacterized protein n=1 Tax=Fomitiporia mediterranea (strain MF3/22) TaxID=694068 RepID=UPI0004408898|nr:uncharacterized protein FOMMEDRAFT_159595 [Fomitiporia mediterranea MF3/22]EJD00014.1 hypothetical protein FOMMEDRAFT_159595 [Fomitiporia mediterranea MF3/22]
MKFLSIFSLAILSASSALAQIIPPKFYPPNGTYYIYNVQYKRIFDNANGVATEGNSIIGWPAHPQATPENQQWLVEGSGNGNNYSVTMRVVSTIQQHPDTGGYAVNLDGKIVHSANAASWTLQPVPNACSQFMIADCNLAIALDNGSAQTVPQAQLTAEAVNPNATNQHWVFVPIDQITEFLTENGSG